MSPPPPSSFADEVIKIKPSELYYRYRHIQYYNIVYRYISRLYIVNTRLAAGGRKMYKYEENFLARIAVACPLLGRHCDIVADDDFGWPRTIKYYCYDIKTT